MDTFPVLKTDRLLLRQFVPTDAQSVFEIFSLDQVTIFLDSETMHTFDEAEKKVRTRINLFQDGKGIRWGITLRDQPATIIGSCGYFSLSSQWFSAEIGYELHPRYWRQGIKTEALKAVIDFGFSDQFYYPLNRIQAQTYLFSEPSMSLLRKLGFQEEGVRRECYFWKNAFHDMRCFSLLRREWVT